MGEILTSAGRIAAADDMIARLKEVLRVTTDQTLKNRKQAEKDLKKWEKLRKNLGGV